MKAKKSFHLKKHDRFDKTLIAFGPENFEIWFNYDDVPCGTYEKIRKVIRILNKYWRENESPRT